MPWLIDSRRFASKVKRGGCSSSASASNVDNVQCEGGFASCPTCGQEVSDDRVFISDWPGCPAGVKFDPTDKELLDHLQAKLGRSGAPLNPLVDEFIPTIDGENGICYRHPKELPGITRDGKSSHFFHRPANAYTKGTRKRRKVHCGEDEVAGSETRWHKTGKTREVRDARGTTVGWKKIMVLYTNFKKHQKPKKTNWVMHQYHLGGNAEERDGELVVSKVFLQMQPRTLKAAAAADSTADSVEGADGGADGGDGGVSDGEESDTDMGDPGVQTQAPPCMIEVDCDLSTVDCGLSKPVPTTPEVLRPLAIRDIRLEFLEEIEGGDAYIVGLDDPEPDMKVLSEMEAEVPRPGRLRCEENRSDVDEDQIGSVASDLGLHSGDVEIEMGLAIPLGTPPDLEGLGSLNFGSGFTQEINEFFGRKSQEGKTCSQEAAGDSQSSFLNDIGF